MAYLPDADSLRNSIAAAPRKKLDLLEVFDEIESTNCYLLAEDSPAPGRFRVAFANYQTAGRGRLGRRWSSPPDSGICMSMSYTFVRKPRNLSCLTLSTGVGVARALQQLGACGIELKWPNDLTVNQLKLGGILTEIHPSSSNSVTVVTGIGLNVDLGSSGTSNQESGLEFAGDLAACFDDLPPRSLISSRLVDALFDTQREFDSRGFSGFAAAWRRLDSLRAKEVSVQQPDRMSTGICQGIDDDGALLLDTSVGRERIVSGSICFAARHGDN